MNLILLFVTLIVSMQALATVNICHVSHLNERLNEKKSIESSQLKAYQLLLKNISPEKRKLFKFTYYKDEKGKTILEKLVKVKKENCDILVGLPTSKENLLAARFVYRQKMMLYSSTASTATVSKYFPYVLSNYPSDVDYGKFIKNDLTKEKSEITVVIQRKGDSFSRSMYNSLIKSGLIHYLVDEKDALSVLSKLDFKKKVSFIFTTELHKSIELLRAMALKSKNVRIYGPLEWGFVPSLKIVKKFKLDPSVKIIIAHAYNQNGLLEQAKKFRHIWNKEFQTLPNDLEAFTYDSFARIVNCIHKANLNKSNFRNCLVRRSSYRGVSTNYQFQARTHPSIELFVETI